MTWNVEFTMADNTSEVYTPDTWRGVHTILDVSWARISVAKIVITPPRIVDEI